MEYNTEQFTPAKVGEDLVRMFIQVYLYRNSTTVYKSCYWSSYVYYTSHIVNFVLPLSGLPFWLNIHVHAKST